MTKKQLEDALFSQARSCRELGSEFNARLLEVIASHLPQDGGIWRRMTMWDGDLSPQGHSVPLRLVGGLHALVLFDKAPALADAYPPEPALVSDATLWSKVETAVRDNDAFMDHWLNSPPQTNEIRRSAILLPGFMEISARSGLTDLKISELGASAGLNLIWDHFYYELGADNWGDPNSAVTLSPAVNGQLPALREVTVVDRAGVDLKPVDLTSEEERTRLLSYIWPDQRDRMTRTAAGIEILQRAETNAPVAEGDAITWLQTRLANPVEGAVHVVYNTIAWQYFPEERKEAGRRLLREAGAKASKEAPLAWLSFEPDGQEPGAALCLTLWPGGETDVIARADYHCRWINWLI